MLSINIIQNFLANDGGVVNVRLPREFLGQTTNFLAAIGSIDVRPNVPARVIINERTGTIVATKMLGFHLWRSAIVTYYHILKSNNWSQSTTPFSQGATTILQGENAELIEEIGRFDTIDQLDPVGASTVNDLASALNRLGLTTREMTSILQSIKNAGALQAELLSTNPRWSLQELETNMWVWILPCSWRWLIQSMLPKLKRMQQ